MFLFSDGNGIRLTIRKDNAPIIDTSIQGFKLSLRREDIASNSPAAVIGIPTKPVDGANKLKRASRNAPQAINRTAVTTPIQPISLNLNNKIKNAGATPNDTISAKESSCFPKSLLQCSHLATKPSITSQKAAIMIIINAGLYIVCIEKNNDIAPVIKFEIVKNEGNQPHFICISPLLAKPIISQKNNSMLFYSKFNAIGSL